MFIYRLLPLERNYLLIVPDDREYLKRSVHFLNTIFKELDYLEG